MLYFENGSTVTILENTESNVRSKRGEEQIKRMQEHYRNKPWLLFEEMYNVKLYWYQKAMIRMAFMKDRYFK